MAEKDFQFPTGALPQLVADIGTCTASDRITVDGAPIGMMYREPPRDETDSGWRFLAGEDSVEFQSASENHRLFDLNAMANHDQAIIPFLQEPIGKAFSRNSEGGSFARTSSPVDPDTCLHPDYPVEDGTVSVPVNNENKQCEWSIQLPYKFNHRHNDGDEVFWRVGMTVFVGQHDNEQDETLDTRLAWLRSVMSEQAYDVAETREVHSARLTYRLDEQRPTGKLYAVYGFHVVEKGHLQIAVYTDDENELDQANSIAQSTLQK